MRLIEGLSLFFVAAFLIAIASAKRWKGSCKYYFDNRTQIDLSPLDNLRKSL